MTPPDIATWTTFFEQVKTGWSAVVTHVTTLTTSMGLVWQVMTGSMIVFMELANIGIQTNISALFTFATQVFTAIGTHWSVIMNSLIANSAAASSGVQSNMSALFEFITQIFDDIANQWSEVMNSVINNAESAADGVTNAMEDIIDSMEDAIDTAEELADAINSIPSMPGQAEGGVLSRAKGGIMSAARGKFFTANGDQLIRVGDNPGGRESIAFIPHNDPGPTLEKIHQMFGTFDKSSGRMGTNSTTMGGSTSGGDVIQVFLDGTQFKGEVVRMIVKNQAAFKV
jgi:hypothetical protein